MIYVIFSTLFFYINMYFLGTALFFQHHFYLKTKGLNRILQESLQYMLLLCRKCLGKIQICFNQPEVIANRVKLNENANLNLQYCGLAHSHRDIHTSQRGWYTLYIQDIYVYTVLYTLYTTVYTLYTVHIPGTEPTFSEPMFSVF